MGAVLIMKRKDYRKSQIKHQLEARYNKHMTCVIWKLDAEQCEIVDELGYTRIPYIYEVTTRPFYNIRMIRETLVKDVHYACKRGRRVLYLKPQKGDLDTLARYGVKYKPYKYQISLIR